MLLKSVARLPLDPCCHRQTRGFDRHPIWSQAGVTALHVACAWGQCHAAAQLLANGAEAAPKTDGPTPAAKDRHAEVVAHMQARAEDHADDRVAIHAQHVPDKPCTEANETPLHWIVKNKVAQGLHNGHEMCARLLLEAAGPDWAVKDCDLSNKHTFNTICTPKEIDIQTVS